MEVIKGSSVSPLKDETDEDILVIISMKDDPDASNQAFTEFHHRFKRFIYGMAIKVTSKLPNSKELCDAVFQNTLINVNNYAGSFKTYGETDPVAIEKLIHGWLVTIAKNELLGLLKDSTPVIDPEELNQKKYGVEDNHNFAEEEKDSESPTYIEVEVQKALSLLSERDQHIFLTYWLYYEKGEGEQAKNLPDDVLNELASKYETSNENIRQIISRAKKKVFPYLEANYNLTNRKN
ncbi:MAG: sigma-70 family RNA polymerase sigma factor [Flavobacteriales bacterium]